jgi:hypothetical protein
VTSPSRAARRSHHDAPRTIRTRVARTTRRERSQAITNAREREGPQVRRPRLFCPPSLSHSFLTSHPPPPSRVRQVLAPLARVHALPPPTARPSRPSRAPITRPFPPPGASPAPTARARVPSPAVPRPPRTPPLAHPSRPLLDAPSCRVLDAPRPAPALHWPQPLPTLHAPGCPFDGPTCEMRARYISISRSCSANVASGSLKTDDASSRDGSGSSPGYTNSSSSVIVDEARGATASGIRAGCEKLVASGSRTPMRSLCKDKSQSGTCVAIGESGAQPWQMVGKATAGWRRWGL